MAKQKNPIAEILKAAGRYSDFSNRSFYTKGLNAALNSGLIELEIVEEGKIKRTSKGNKYNTKVSAGGYNLHFYVSGRMTPGDILPRVGTLLLDERVKKVISADVHLRADHCQKCNGEGIIPQFHYYCNGICFNCGGTGQNFSNDKTTVKIHNQTQK